MRVLFTLPPATTHLFMAAPLAWAFRAAGHEVSTAHSAAQALALLEHVVPDVAILDIGLPDLDGYALAERLRARLAPWHGRLIALTGYGQAADKARAEAAGFDLHFTKPADPAALLSAVEAPRPPPAAAPTSP